MWYKLTILLLLRNPLLLSTPNQTGKYELIPKTIGYHMTVWAAGQSVNTGIQNRTSGNILNFELCDIWVQYNEFKIYHLTKYKY